VRLELRLRNHLFRTASVEITLKLPAGFTCEFPRRTLQMAGKTQAAVPFDIVRPAAASGSDEGTDIGRAIERSRGRRRAVTADITINGRRIGEYAEAVIDPPGAPKLDAP
jgi:hypothetical protein